MYDIKLPERSQEYFSGLLVHDMEKDHYRFGHYVVVEDGQPVEFGIEEKRDEK